MNNQPAGARPLYGLLAEFGSAQALIAAARKSRASGFGELDAFTPYPIEELSSELGHHRSKLPRIVLVGGLSGGLGGFLLQYFTSVIAYPLNVGGRPLNSWPAFIVPTFECTILAAALAAVLGMLFLNKLPQPHHPVFNVPRFALASRDRYFLTIKSNDPRFDRERTREFLEALGPSGVWEVEY
jgi:hypothetical protein